MTRVARGSIFSGAKHFHVLTDGLPKISSFNAGIYSVTTFHKSHVSDTALNIPVG